MKHQQYIRELPESNTAVLFIHGILGTPDHFTRLGLVEEVPENWSIYNILLAGHGGTADDFAAATMDQWKGQVHRLTEELCRRYEHVYMVAHSMGTLFAIKEALQQRRIERLFLINVPLRATLKSTIVINSLRVIFDKISDGDAVAAATRDAYSITPDRRLWKYVKWIPNYLALFTEIRSTRKKIKEISIPCFVFQSKEDELVALSAVKYLKGNDHIKCWLLPHSGHFYYAEKDAAQMARAFRRFCRG